jgi:gelsolin
MATKNTSHNDNSKISWKDTNLALIGSELDHKMKQAAGARESAWVEGTIGQSPGLYIWRIEQFQVKVWPKEKHSQFHKGDSYIVLKSYREGNSEALHHDIHIWIGQESSQDEYGTAAYKMVEADDYLGGTPIQHRQIQGHEDDTFKSYFEVMEYLEGGIESGFRHVEPDMEHPVLFRVTGGRNRGVKTTMTLTQILPLSKSSLNEGDSFILTCGKAKVWCWHGKYAKPLEKNYSNQWAEKMVRSKRSGR